MITKLMVRNRLSVIIVIVNLKNQDMSSGYWIQPLFADITDYM